MRWCRKSDPPAKTPARLLPCVASDDLADARDDEEQAKLENTAIANLKHAEKAWLSYRDVQCNAAADFDPGSIAPMIYSQCLKTLTEHRIADLKSIYEGRGRKLD